MTENKTSLYKMGTAYYPDYAPFQSYDLESTDGREIPPKERISQDFARMQKAGISEVRMGEFSWSSVEPKEGCYTPELFLHALDMAQKYELEVIFCTPTATPPKWLIDKHPDILPILADDRKIHFGSRRHYDPCNSAFKEYTRKITTYFAKTFGSHPSVKMWQIDNELGHHGSSSVYTSAADEQFRVFLKDKYQNIQALNKAWFTCFWSQGYTSFDQIEIPRQNWTDANPHAEFDFKRFCTSVFKGYQKLQIDILKSICPNLPITHNLISNAYELCPWEMTKDLDVVGFDHYQDFDYPTPVRSASNFTLLGSLARVHSDRKFKILEQQPIQVNWQKINRRFPFDWLLLWAGQSAFLGADTMDYFSWQKFYGGSEQYHDGVLPHDLRNKCSNQEKLLLASNSMFKKINSELNWTEFPDVDSDILIIHNTESLWTHRIASQSEYYDSTIQIDELTETLTGMGLGVHYQNNIPNQDTLKKYNLVILPGYSFTLNSEESISLESYMSNGGTVLTMPRSLMKTKDNHMSTMPLAIGNKNDFYFEEYGAMGPEEEELVEASNGLMLSSHRWSEKIVITNSMTIESVATYKNGLYQDAPAILKQKIGDGSHYHLAFCPKHASEFSQFLSQLIPPKVISEHFGRNIQVIPLESGHLGVVNFSNEDKSIELQESKLNKLTFSIDKNLSLVSEKDESENNSWNSN